MSLHLPSLKKQPILTYPHLKFETQEHYHLMCEYMNSTLEEIATSGKSDLLQILNLIEIDGRFVLPVINSYLTSKHRIVIHDTSHKDSDIFGNYVSKDEKTNFATICKMVYLAVEISGSSILDALPKKFRKRVDEFNPKELSRHKVTGEVQNLFNAFSYGAINKETLKEELRKTKDEFLNQKDVADEDIQFFSELIAEQPDKVQEHIQKEIVESIQRKKKAEEERIKQRNELDDAIDNITV